MNMKNNSGRLERLRCSTTQARQTKAPLTQVTLAHFIVLAALFLSTGIIYPQEPPLRQLTTHAASDEDPSWSPDGQKIAFRSNRSGNYDIWVMDADGGNLRRLTTHIARDVLPSWSPDGQKIAFSSDRNGNGDIWVMDADGGNKRQLTTHVTDDWGPSWSPDGGRIAFVVKNKYGNNDIWVMDADGDRKRQLTTYRSYDGQPSWSPDGRKIAFNSLRGGNGDIWVMDADADNKRRITTYEGSDGAPSWSPDGREIVFRSRKNRNTDIWVLNVLEALQPSISIASRERATTLIPPGKPRTSVLNTAIVEFQEKGSLDIEDAGEIVAGWMSSSLIKTGAFTLYERVLLYKILEEQDLGLTGALDEKTTAQIGKIFGVEAIVTGTVSKFGSTISVVAKLIDTETAKVIASSDVKTTSVDEIPGAMDRLARELAKEP